MMSSSVMTDHELRNFCQTVARSTPQMRGCTLVPRARSLSDTRWCKPHFDWRVMPRCHLMWFFTPSLMAAREGKRSFREANPAEKNSLLTSVNIVFVAGQQLMTVTVVMRLQCSPHTSLAYDIMCFSAKIWHNTIWLNIIQYTLLSLTQNAVQVQWWPSSRVLRLLWEWVTFGNHSSQWWVLFA